MLLKPNGQPLSFDKFKSRMAALEKEQLELIKALEETTRNLEIDAVVIGKLRHALNKYMTYAEIDALINEHQNPEQLGTAS